MRSFAFALLLLASTGAHAIVIGTEAYAQNWDLSGPHVSAYSCCSSQVFDNVAAYDPAVDLFSISSSSSALYRMRFSFSDQFDYSGSMSLLMGINEDRESSGGVFSLFGTIPELGIDTQSLLLAGSVVGANVFVGDYTPYASMQFLIDLSYANPYFGDWGSEILLSGLNGTRINCCATLTTENMFTTAWSSTPADYWDILPFTHVPEPSPLSLLVGGLLLLALRTQRAIA